MYGIIIEKGDGWDEVENFQVDCIPNCLMRNFDNRCLIVIQSSDDKF